MIGILIALIAPCAAYAQQGTPEFMLDPKAFVSYMEQKNGQNDCRVDNTLIDERVMSILQAFYDGYQRKTLLDAIDFERMADAILDALKKGAESEPTPYTERYWQENQLIKMFLENPETIIPITHDEYPDLSYSVTYHDVLKKVLEYHIVLYTYTILCEKIWCFDLYDTGIKVYNFDTFLSPEELQKCITIIMYDTSHNNHEATLKIPKSIIPYETKNQIDAFINAIPIELLVPYTDGLLHSCNSLSLSRSLLRKQSLPCKLVPIFAKKEPKLLRINTLLIMDNKKKDQSTTDNEKSQPVEQQSDTLE
jgi:hypothetical protein